ncbi:hypothetical protein X777_08951 [Ooceraea biroi]|uniref:Transmembrane protein n=1 Tax=Ooceraea biroi TaxID=2015173 RepID=A0A026W9D0_OOCBI|nr:hypothetical protein X777_08951 [Ooceraea biroi]
MSGCIIYPPTEFMSLGLTVKDIFAHWLGSENEFFIQYHIKRSTITLLVHSILPLGSREFIHDSFFSGYIVGLIYLDHIDVAKLLFTGESPIRLLIVIYITIGPLCMLNEIGEWFIHDWALHPIAQNLSAYSNSNTSWITVACDINTEYRRVDKLIIITNSITRIVVTDNWIIKVTPYKLYVAHQNDTTLVVNKSDTHVMSPTTRDQVQYINIQVSSLRAMTQGFDIRLNALTFEDLQDKVSRPIIVSQNITFHKTMLDLFIDTFKKEVDKNPFYETVQELERCIGCMQAFSNIKLMKLCNNSIGNRHHYDCEMCYCRPMWCVECMAKWFASKQDDNELDTWLSSKCTCPVCRAPFCILDVCYVRVPND